VLVNKKGKKNDSERPWHANGENGRLVGRTGLPRRLRREAVYPGWQVKED